MKRVLATRDTEVIMVLVVGLDYLSEAMRPHS